MSTIEHLEERINSLRFELNAMHGGGHNSPGWHDIEAAEKRIGKTLDVKLSSLEITIADNARRTKALADALDGFVKMFPGAVNKAAFDLDKKMTEAIVEQIVEIEKTTNNKIDGSLGTIAREAATMKGLIAQEACDARDILTAAAYTFAHNQEQ